MMDRVTAFAAIQKAVVLKEGVSQQERDYIDALAVRYNGDPSTPREPLDLTYVDAMRKVHHNVVPRTTMRHRFLPNQ